MGRYKEAPWGFECPYQNACPHLGMSTTWASLEIKDARKQRGFLGLQLHRTEEYVKKLEEENAALEAENAELKSRLKQQHQLKFKANKKVPDHPRDPAPKRRGAPQGHPGWQRTTPRRVDRSVHVDAPDTCPHCRHEGLEPVDKTHVQIQEDIVLQPRTVVTEYIHQKAFCPICRREVFDTADGELRNCNIGPITKATAVYLRHSVKLSYRDVQKVLSGLFGISFAPASAMAFSHQTADAGAALYEDLRNKVRAAHIIHGDETHWRIDGKSAQLWYAGNTGFDFFHADYSRGSKVAAAIFGTAFGGYLNADSYAGYNIINPLGRQACLAHIKRKADEIADRMEMLPKKKQDPSSIHFCRALSRLTSRCCKLGRKRNSGKLAFKKGRALIPKLEKMRDELCASPLKDDDAENLRKRVSLPSRDGKRLFVFLEVNGMEPTNNHAEQALRLPVIFRKISFGSRSLEGAQNLAINLSLMGTAKRQNKDPIGLLKSLLLNREKTPIEKLYQPENIPSHDTS